jgi:hypothetical protein
VTSLTIKIPADLKQRLEREAKLSGRSVSALIREAMAERLHATEGETSLYDRTKDLCGAGASGQPDLATNPEHLKSFGE